MLEKNKGKAACVESRKGRRVVEDNIVSEDSTKRSSFSESEYESSNEEEIIW